jgi:cytochrome P450 RapN
MTTQPEPGSRGCPFHSADFTAERLDLDPKYARLRAERPLVRVTMPHGGDAWVATRYEDVKTVLGDPRFSRAATVGKDVPRSSPLIQQDSSLLSMDPPQHTRLRKLAAKAFTVRRANTMRPRVQAIVDGLVDGLEAAPWCAAMAGAQR